MRHLVVRQIFDVRLPSRQQAYGIQQRLSRFFWDAVAPALEQLFDRLAPGDAILRIDKLEIDLGSIRVEALTDQEVLRRIVAAVEVQLLKISVLADGTQQRIQKPDNYFEQWLYFMEYGALPWHANKSEWQAWRTPVIETIASSTAAVEQIRQLVQRNEDAFDRLILQHDSAFLQTIATLFSGVAQQTLSAFVAELTLIVHEIGGIRVRTNDTHLTPRQAITWFWKWVLHTLIVRQQKIQGDDLVATFLHTAPDVVTFNKIVNITARKKGAKKFPVLTRALTMGGGVGTIQQVSSTEAAIAAVRFGQGDENRSLAEPLSKLVSTEEITSIPETKSARSPKPNDTATEGLTPASENLIGAIPARHVTQPIPSGKEPIQKALPEEKTIIPDSTVTTAEKIQKQVAETPSPDQEQHAQQSQPAPQASLVLNDEANQSLKNNAEETADNQAVKSALTEDKSATSGTALRPESKKDDTAPEAVALGNESQQETIRSQKDTQPIPATEKTAQETPLEQKAKPAEKYGVAAETTSENSALEISDPAVLSPPGKREQPGGILVTLPDNVKAWQLDNTGIVLLQAFLPAFFKTLELTDGKKFLSRESQDKAACLLHYLATGATSTPEYELLLPKILCGIPLGVPLDSDITVSPEESEEADALLQAVIGHWTALGSVSADGLREGFLRRPGKLVQRDNGWRLQIERHTIDILLDRAPFSVGVVKLPWMKEILWVEW